jgi:hypothetical protein
MRNLELSLLVEAFITQHVESPEQLQLLLTMVEEPERWWDADSAARELFVSRSAGRSTLEHLAAHNLLEIKLTGDVRYRFSAGTTELRDGTAALALAYKKTPLAVIRAVTSGRRRSLQDFADAFRIKRDDR